MQLELLNEQGQSSAKVDAPDTVFGRDYNEALVHQIVVAYQANARQGTRAQLDRAEAVVTGCAVAVSETGTICLDHGAGQGRRALSLIPDLHVCVVRENQIVQTVRGAVERLGPAVRAGRPLTWLSGGSATSDIELVRVEGVHGPRALHVIVVAE